MSVTFLKTDKHFIRPEILLTVDVLSLSSRPCQDTHCSLHHDHTFILLLRKVTTFKLEAVATGGRLSHHILERILVGWLSVTRSQKCSEYIGWRHPGLERKSLRLTAAKFEENGLYPQSHRRKPRRLAASRYILCSLSQRDGQVHGPDNLGRNPNCSTRCRQLSFTSRRILFSKSFRRACQQSHEDSWVIRRKCRCIRTLFWTPFLP